MSDFFETTEACYDLRTKAAGPAGELPVTDRMLREWPSGHLFGLSQNAGMGWKAEELGRKQWLILSTQGGMRDEAGQPVALGYHTGHWEIAKQVRAGAEELRRLKGLPFAAFVSDPCDGRTQGTTGMFDSLPYRNDAAVVFRRLIRSLPQRSGVMGVATCDKGLPAMMMALAGMRDLPVVLVPGGVTLPPETGEDAGAVQTLGARYVHGMVTLQEAAEAGCRACASPGGGCQFLGTAATSQVVGEALGLSVAHSALAPSGEAVWLELARRSARALVAMEAVGTRSRDILTDAAVRNAMVVHAAFGGSTNLLLHIPAIAHAAGLRRPVVADWTAVNRATPRLVSVLPNGPVHHPTVQVFLAGGVPEVMLHLRELGLLDLSVLTVGGQRLEAVLREWENGERRRRFRDLLFEKDGVNPDDVILSPVAAAAAGMRSTVTFLTGNICPEGAIIKSGAIDPQVVDADGVYRFEGPVRFFTGERLAMAAIKDGSVKAGQVLVLAGCGPMGTGMEETYQLTSALKFLPFGKDVALITDARFSGVSTGACIGHAGPEALAGGPLGKLREGDRVRIEIDLKALSGTVDFLGVEGAELTREEGASVLSGRESDPRLAPHAELPDDTRLWAALQQASGGTWGGCVFDVEGIIKKLRG
jgi:xylonate dehydratase